MMHLLNRLDYSNVATEQPAFPRNPGILIADDMQAVLSILKIEFERLGFTVWLAVDGDDALDLYQSNRAEIDLVLLDVQMPGMNGPRTLAAIQSVNPDVLACFMTGDTGNYTEEDLCERGAAGVFSKPFHAAELARSLLRILEVRDSETKGRDRRRLPRSSRAEQGNAHCRPSILPLGR